MFAPPHCHEPLSSVVPLSVTAPGFISTRPEPEICPPVSQMLDEPKRRVPLAALTMERLVKVEVLMTVSFVPPDLEKVPKLWNTIASPPPV